MTDQLFQNVRRFRVLRGAGCLENAGRRGTRVSARPRAGRGLHLLRALLLTSAALPACSPVSRAPAQSTPSPRVWEGEPRTITTHGEARREIELKLERVNRFLDEEQLAGILLTQVRNFAWITAGLATNQIVLNKDVGAASLLILRDGRKYLLSTGAESGRLMEETLAELGYEARVFNWYDANPVTDVRGDLIEELARGGRVGSDAPFPGTIPVADAFEPLRYSLTATELERYRWLGRETTEAVQEVLRRVRRGMDEFEIEAMTAAALRARGIVPTVLLIAVDDRVAKYRHALPGGKALERYVMVNVVADKWGMSMAVTRFAHFGPLPAELEEKLEKTAGIMARYQEITRPGVRAADIFEAMKGWYADAGYPEEWRLHHQGGAIGYDDRDWVIYPGIDAVVQAGQAFAWNPTITGAKVEDTIVVDQAHTEVVTRAGEWPMIPVTLNGRLYEQPGILIR